MKKAAFFLTCLVSLSLALTACQPEDKNLADAPEIAKCPRCKIKGQAQEKGFPAGSNVRGPGFFALSAIMVEKEVEAVQLVRLALGLEDAATSGYTVDKSANGETVTLVSDSKPFEYETEQGTFKTTVRKTITALVPANPVDGTLVDIAAGNFNQSVDRIGQKRYLNWIEDAYTLNLAQSTKSADELTLGVETVGSYNTAAGKNTFNLSLVLVLDKASLQSGTVKVKSAWNKLSYQQAKAGSRQTVIELEGRNHEIESKGECYSLTSESTILTDRAKKKLVYKASAAEVVDSTFKTSAAACESRPTVDLSRGFVF